jgi:3-phenylpropionate/trans-cinnamate dioxygenase ferredoxin subunit
VAWHEAAGAQALGDQEAMGITLGERDIVVCRSGGEYYALHGICTHQSGLLADGCVEGGQIECPLHQGRFDLKTGAALGPPVTEPLCVYRVKSEGGKVYIEIGD